MCLIKPIINYFTVCENRSLFDDKPLEIQELTYIVKQDISSLRKNLLKLEQRRGNSQQGKDAQKHTYSIVKNLKVRFCYILLRF